MKDFDIDDISKKDEKEKSLNEEELQLKYIQYEDLLTEIPEIEEEIAQKSSNLVWM